MTLLHRIPPRAASRAVRTTEDAGVGQPNGTRLTQRTRTASQVAVLGAVAAGLAAPGWFEAHQMWVLAAGFLLGLPHGAVDHLLPVRHAWVRRGAASMAGVLLSYLALALLTWAGLRWAGPVVLPVLLAVSVLHFGAGDLATDAASESARTYWLTAAGRGAPVVAGPLLAWPAATGTALATVGLGRAPSSGTALVVGLGLLGLSVVTALLAVRAGRAAVALEIWMLVLLFVVLPPLAAFGVYFGAWHGLRHTARLLVDDPRNAADLAHRRLARPLGRFLRDAAAPCLVALAPTAGLVALAAGRTDLVGPVFELLLALTVPHVVVVLLWDRTLAQQPGTRPAA